MSEKCCVCGSIVDEKEGFEYGVSTFSGYKTIAVFCEKCGKDKSFDELSNLLLKCKQPVQAQ